ncbi:aldehyde oxidase and xanthine dehydrogenase molybdopterin binding protein, partial [mine drainage metagenome]
MREGFRPARPWDRTPVGERAYFDLLGPGIVAVAAGRDPPAASTGGWQPPTGGAWIHLGEDGAVTAFTGKVEIGQGTRGALTRAVALELGVEPRSVRLVMGDTDLCPWDLGTFGSRSMPDALPALRVAAAALRSAVERRPPPEGGAPGLGARVRGLRTVVEVPAPTDPSAVPPLPAAPAPRVADD